MNLEKCTLTVVVALLMLGSDSVSLAAAQEKRITDLAAEDQIREVVLRYQMTGWATNGDKAEEDAKTPLDRTTAKTLNWKIYFLSVKGQDPTEEFLKRFQSFPRKIEKVSEATQTKEFPGWVVDKKTKEQGIIFGVGEIRWKTDGEVEVDGGHHCGGLCGTGNVFTVKLKGGKWTVTRDVMEWIS